MTSKVADLIKRKIITDAPFHLKSNIHYEVRMGSYAYGVSTTSSDIDIYGFLIPPKDELFPHLRGEIPLFDSCKPRFEQYQRHHIMDGEDEYDVTIYNIAKYFRLLADNNPNIIDSLFVPQNCILHCTSLAQHIRENRKTFLHKGCWKKFKGYAYSQIKKMKNKNHYGKRKKIADKFGYDVRYAYHAVRLLCEVEQILKDQDLDLTRNSEILNEIRRGEWPLEKVEEFFSDKEKSLEDDYNTSPLPPIPNIIAIRQLLLESLESHYGSLPSGTVKVVEDEEAQKALTAIKRIVEYYTE